MHALDVVVHRNHHVAHGLEAAAHHAKGHGNLAVFYLTMAGMMVCNGRLAGAMRWGWSGLVLQPLPRFWNMMPDLPVTMPTAKLKHMEFMKDTLMRFLSTTLR